MSGFFDSHIDLEQGDPSSPLMFMLFINDIIRQYKFKLQNIFTIDELKISMILYADDAIVFAKIPDVFTIYVERYTNLLHNMVIKNKYQSYYLRKRPPYKF